MQTHAWNEARCGLVDPACLQVIAVGDKDSWEAVLPTLSMGGWIRELPAMFEPSDIAWRSLDGLRALVEELARQGRPLFLERLPATSPTVAVLRQAFARRGLLRLEAAMPTPFIRIEGQGGLEHILGSRRRADLRRAERRAERLGHISYEIHAPSDDFQLAGLLDEAYGLETRSWKYPTGTALTADARQGAFFRRFARAASRDRHLRLAFLRIDGKPVAMQIASEWQQRFWLYKMSYDRTYAGCSPGQLLMYFTLNHALSQGLQSYEFMGVMADWTRLWTRDLRHYVQVRAIPYSLASLDMAARRAVRGAFRRARTLIT